MNWIKVGSVPVEAGIIWIGDPCLIGRKFSQWHKFVSSLPNDGSVKQFDEGICSPSGVGDGCYSVYAQREDGIGIAKLLIDFTGEMEDTVEEK